MQSINAISIFIGFTAVYPAPPREPGRIPVATKRYIGSYLTENSHILSELIVASLHMLPSLYPEGQERGRLH